MIVGGAGCPGVVAALQKYPKIAVIRTTDDWRLKVVEKEIRAAVEIPEGFEKKVSQGQGSTVKIDIYGGEIKSEFAAGNIESYLKEYRDGMAAKRLEAKSLPANLLRPFQVKKESLASPEKQAGAILGGIIAYALILMCLNGAMHPWIG